MPATAIGFVNAGIFDDIGNGIAGAANDVSDFTVDAAEDVAKNNNIYLIQCQRTQNWANDTLKD
jgi:hypothetical protein